MKSVCVMGAGTWGTTLAIILGEKEYDVRLWARREEVASRINSKHENPDYLPGAIIPDSVRAGSSLKDSVAGADMIVVAVPSQFLRQAMRSLRVNFRGQIIVSAVKGLESPACKRMSELISEELGGNVRIAALSGPNHAHEISMKKPTATAIASHDGKLASKVAEYFSTPYFKAYHLTDIGGVEICGALKNVYAIACGICDGSGLGGNSKASIITLSLTEMNRFARHFGAKRATIYGLAGVGDLILTCYSGRSRNWFVGYHLANGKMLGEIEKEMYGMVAEGIFTTKAVYEFCSKHDMDFPLMRQTFEVLFRKKKTSEAISELLKMV